MSGHDAMIAIGRELLAQDNLATAEPIFYVEALDRQYHVNADCSDDGEWMDEDCERPDADELAALERLRSVTGAAKFMGWRFVRYIDRWTRVTACLTRPGAEAFIAADGHNHTRHGVPPRIYVGSGYRNAEWIAIRSYLIELAGGAS